jgi:hypothetical protein
MKYSLWIVAVLVLATLFAVEAKKKPINNKYEGDFEFVDEVRHNNRNDKIKTSYF